MQRAFEDEKAICEDIKKDVLRHVDDVESAHLEWDKHSECEFCGSTWTEDANSSHNGGCCEKDLELFLVDARQKLEKLTVKDFLNYCSDRIRAGVKSYKATPSKNEVLTDFVKDTVHLYELEYYYRSLKINDLGGDNYICPLEIEDAIYHTDYNDDGRTYVGLVANLMRLDPSVLMFRELGGSK